jgi:N-acetylmuramoyl-L-alanine amidase
MDSRWARVAAVVGTAVLALGATAGARAATVTVRPGETLGDIATRSGVSIPALAAENGITNPNRVVAGRVLRLPVSSDESAPVVHRVRAGETLSAIAARYGVSVGTLVKLNALRSPHRIVVGRLLRVPSGPGAPQSPLPTRVAASSAPPPPAADGSREQVSALIADASATHGVDPALARAVAWQESGWNQGVVSPVGAVGVMQLMPKTAAWVGAKLLGRRIDPSVVEDNVEGGVAYLGWLLQATGDRDTAVAAYYQGLTSVRARGLLAETRRYVANVAALTGRV